LSDRKEALFATRVQSKFPKFTHGSPIKQCEWTIQQALTVARGKGRDRKKARQRKLQTVRAAQAMRPLEYKDEMGIFHEYLSKNLTPPQIDSERKRQLARIGQLRNSGVITYAARIGQLPQHVDISISYEDILPFKDTLDAVTGDRVTIILETPGGFGEVGKDMVEMLHERFSYVEFLIPGTAKSTGTIMCLGGHEILMGSGSSLGPIDAQLLQDGKRYSADALIEGFKSIKEEVEKTGQLNPAYIPMLQRISPGELQAAENALEFARDVVSDWLVRYKFAQWERSGTPVSDDEKRERAREIANNLSKQSKWFSHSRSLRIPDLQKLGLKITDFGADATLNDAVLRYQVLLRMTFEMGPLYKIYETPTTIITRRFQVPALNPDQVANLVGQVQNATSIQVGTNCPKCKHPNQFQLDFAPKQPLQPGAKRFPNASTTPCERCGEPLDLTAMRAAIEKQVGKPALTPQPT
jgi:hypothetical protein